MGQLGRLECLPVLLRWRTGFPAFRFPSISPVFLSMGSGESVRTRKVKIMAHGDGAPWKL